MSIVRTPFYGRSYCEHLAPRSARKRANFRFYLAKQLHADKLMDIATNYATLGISRTTLYRVLYGHAEDDPAPIGNA